MAVHIHFEVSPAAGLPEELSGHARFINEGPGPVTWLPMQVEAPALALEVEDAAGSPVRLPPPPVPDPTVRRFELAAGESYDTTYPGFLPSWTEPGRYRVRVRLAPEPRESECQSEWIDVVVTPGPGATQTPTPL